MLSNYLLWIFSDRYTDILAIDIKVTKIDLALSLVRRAFLCVCVLVLFSLFCVWSLASLVLHHRHI